ncbi:glycosyltransferase family 39 protein [Gimesia aquarii]|uniref:Uncharacterized protein n=1 Tax=Gimesia aquarii TaxID=2527964 RepID=A0A517VU50_9PLAN|nr:glycosyltransferase family 39 protein [Gimesia aquarii]QDT96526.1 hypothetical protein V144x_19830 [Gimesia aquarii]
MTTSESPQNQITSASHYSTLWWLIPITVIAVSLRMQNLSDVGYLFDESFSLQMVEFPLDEMWERIPEDISPPMFYLLLKSWIGLFGDTPFATRMLSVVLGTIVVLGVYLFAYEAYRKLGDVSSERQAQYIAVTASLLVALCPLHITFAQRIRMYSFGTALAVLSSWFLFRALNRPKTGTRDWVCFTLTAILFIYTHYFGMFTIAVEYVFALGYLFLNSPEKKMAGRLKHLWPWLISVSAVWFIWSPWIPQFLYQRSHVNQTFWSSPLTWDRFGSQISALFDLNLVQIGSSNHGLLIAEICFVLLIILLLGRRPADIFIAMAACIPILVAVIISKLSRSVFAFRYLQFSQIFMLIAISVILSRVPTKPARMGATLLILMGMGYLSWRHYEVRHRYALMPGMKTVIARFEQTRGPDEKLICCNPMLFTSADAYSKQNNAIYVNGSARRYPYFQGTAVIQEAEYLTPSQYLGENIEAVWTLDAQRWFNSTWSVEMPAGWKKAGEMRFPEFYADLILRLYVREKDSNTGLTDTRE